MVELARDADPGVVEKAIVALGEIEEPKALPVLLALADSPKPAVRRAATRALGVYRTPESLAKLVSLLKETDKDVLIAACGAPRPAEGQGCRQTAGGTDRAIGSVATRQRRAYGCRRRLGGDHGPGVRTVRAGVAGGVQCGEAVRGRGIAVGPLSRLAGESMLNPSPTQ